MKKGLILAAALLALAACGEEPQPEARNMSAEEVAAELSSVTIEPGLWESSSQIVDVSAPNLPVEAKNMMIRRSAASVRNCITPEQAERPDANFLAAQQNSNCAYQNFSMENGQLTGTMVCTGGAMPGQMRAEMKGEYGPQAYDMRMTMSTSGMPEGADMTIETRVTGRRIGDCPEAGAEG